MKDEPEKSISFILFPFSGPDFRPARG